jgi:hypothetical protein
MNKAWSRSHLTREFAGPSQPRISPARAHPLWWLQPAPGEIETLSDLE